MFVGESCKILRRARSDGLCRDPVPGRGAQLLLVRGPWCGECDRGDARGGLLVPWRDLADALGVQLVLLQGRLGNESLGLWWSVLRAAMLLRCQLQRQVDLERALVRLGKDVSRRDLVFSSCRDSLKVRHAYDSESDGSINVVLVEVFDAAARWCVGVMEGGQASCVAR